MNFVDRVTLRVTAGTGGSGCTSFRREMFVPKGGPDGGDGGRGGSIFLQADAHLTTLLDYRYNAHRKAERGQHGMGSNKTGKSGEDIYLPVPPGTVALDAASGESLGEVVRPGEALLVAKGGRGGRGNARFATSTHQAPREWEPGDEGEDRTLELVLKLLADVGVLGEPNAGKSTLLSVVSAAKPKIAEYPFTTLTPQLGVVGLSGGRSFVMADIPGLIEGAHEGKGLGDRFLQHVERTRVLAYLIPVEVEDPQASYDTLRAEVEAYDPKVAAKPHLVVLTKRDLLPPETAPPAIIAPQASGVVAISSVAHRGLDELKEELWKLLAGSVEPSSDDAVPLP
ncbi:MAG: GTPase ObgE [Gemmatimonadota bacterium]|nr:MAG: GTPase ObgE [Gemmatimonadota bacterium]